MEFKRGDTVWLNDEECTATVLTADASDGTYRVWIEDEEKGIADWDWVTEKQVSLPPEPACDPAIVEAGAGPQQNTQGPFGVPSEDKSRLKVLGWRMYYANTSQRRKEQPVTEGFLDYFPAAVRLAAELSRLGNEKHRGPGVPLRHARGVSGDHRDCAVRHLMDADSIDSETDLAEAVAALWRCAAYVQELAEKTYGWPVAPAASFPDK